MPERLPALLYIDTDASGVWSGAYERLHRDAASDRGLRRVIIAPADRADTDELRSECEELVLLEAMARETVVKAAADLTDRYDVRAVYSYTGQVTELGSAGGLAAEVAVALGLRHPSPAAVEACNNKHVMRAVLERAGLSSMRYAVGSDESSLRRAAEHVGFPLIAKPTFGGGSSFVAVCNDINEVLRHGQVLVARHANAVMRPFMGYAHRYELPDGSAHDYQPGHSLLLETYLDGLEGTAECACTSGRSRVVMLEEKLKLTVRSGTVLEDSLITPPTDQLGDPAELVQHSEAALDSLGLRNTLAHLEFRVVDGRPEVIEVNPRIGGLYVSRAFDDIAGTDAFGLGLDLLMDSTNAARTVERAVERAQSATGHWSMAVVYPQRSGHVIDVTGRDWPESDPRVLHCRFAEGEVSVEADTEENFLVRCWARVTGADDARDLHRDLITAVQPVYAERPLVRE